MTVITNILGEGRSGTTMLDLMLGSATDAFSVGEVYAWLRPWRTYHYQLKCSCGQDPCRIWQEIRSVPEEFFHSKLSKLVEKTHIIDSSKNLNWVIDNNIRAQNQNNRVFNILIYKHPIDSYYSFWKRGVSYWKWYYGYVSYHIRLFQSHLPFLAISLDELITNPPDTIKKVCAVIGLQYTVGQEKFWEFEHHILSGSAGTMRQIDQVGEIQQKNYQSPFKENLEQYQRRMSRSLPLSSIVRKVINQDYKIPQQGLHKNIKKPVWYYYYQLKSRYRRAFPVKWMPSDNQK